ncbi:MAG: hypothetical protein WC373_04910 [Smithella sp.]|jgi:hypothetical protein
MKISKIQKRIDVLKSFEFKNLTSKGLKELKKQVYDLLKNKTLNRNLF